MVNHPNYGSTPDNSNNNAHSQRQDMITPSHLRATDADTRHLISAGMLIGVAAIGFCFLGYGYKTSMSSPPLLAALSGQTGRGRGQHRFREQVFDPTLLVNQQLSPPPPPPPKPPVQENCNILDFWYPVYANTNSQDNLSSRGIIYSVDNIVPNKYGSFSAGPALGVQFETYTVPGLVTLDGTPSFSDYVSGMFLLDPVVNNDGVTTYQSSVSYNGYTYATTPAVGVDYKFITPPERPVTGGTGNYLCASGSYNYRVGDDNFYNVTGTDNEVGFFYLGRLIISDSCQAGGSPKHPKKTKSKSKSKK